MSLMPSIMSLFGGKAPTPPVADPTTQIQQTQMAAANPSVPSLATPQSNGSVAAIPVAGVGAQSPNDQFNELWKTDPNNNQVTPSLVPAFNLDAKGLMEAAKRTNFTAHIPDELITKAMGGDKASFMEVINQAAQLGFANATAASGELIKGSLTSAQGVLQDKVLPNALRQQEISRAIDASNPVFSDPAISPMLGMLKNQLAMKYPSASPEEIAKTAASYLSSMSTKIATANGSTITPKATGSSNGFNRGQEPDWEKFFDA